MGNNSLFLSESIGCQLKEDRHENRWECPDPGHNEDPTREEGGELAGRIPIRSRLSMIFFNFPAEKLVQHPSENNTGD